MKNEICANPECGHKEKFHLEMFKSCRLNCPCKKFNVVNSAKELNKLIKNDLKQLEKLKGCGKTEYSSFNECVTCGKNYLCPKCKPKNHSQQDNRKTAGSVGDLKLIKAGKDSGLKSHPADTLSDKIFTLRRDHELGHEEDLLLVKHIKESIKKLKEELKHYLVDFEEIDKIFGKKLCE